MPHDAVKLDKNDFWMGMAFMFASRSKSGHASVLVDGNTLISYGLENPSFCNQASKLIIPSEISVIVNSNKKFEYATLYSTKTITIQVALTIIAATGIKKVVYYPSDPLDEGVLQLFSGIYTELTEYKGNLYWLQDYVKSLDLFQGDS